MAGLRRLAVALLGAAFIQPSLSQGVSWTDPETSIPFTVFSDYDHGVATLTDTSGRIQFGISVPADALTAKATEYIGYISCNTKGWCGMSHGGAMTNSLLLLAWPDGNEIQTAFRWASGYDTPGAYTGDAKVTQIRSKINSTGFELVYRCQGCFQWNQNGVALERDSTQGYFVLGWASCKVAPKNAHCPSTMTHVQHDNGFGMFGAPLDGALNAKYAAHAALATHTPETCGAATASSTATPTSADTSGTSGATSSATPTVVVKPECKALPDQTYDYIIVGAGAGGIPLADKLTEAGHKVLLIEKGPPSTGRWGGTMKPGWLNTTQLTRFDVPGLCNQIWHDSKGIACPDTDQMAGCVLGGGTAVNAGLWWKPNPLDWDYNFPTGWKNTDVRGATDRVFKRIPGTITPSQDGKLYRQEGFNVLSEGLRKSGWSYVIPNNAPDRKNRTYGHTTFMFANGERGGPLATYLETASKRNGTFTLVMNTAVNRIRREKGHATGVETDCVLAGGYGGFAKLTPGTGRVVVSAGTFGSAKLLMRSGIGPKDQLAVVKKSASDGATMIGEEDWIELPVGYNLVDHLNTDTVVAHTDVVFHDFYVDWDGPDPIDKKMYLEKRAGILAMAAPNIGPMMWDQIKGSDNITRQLQWTSRVEGSLGETSVYAMTMSQYLGRGSVSRGRMSLSGSLDTYVSVQPFLTNAGDKEAVIKGIDNMRAALKNVPNLIWLQPPPNVTSADYVNAMLVSANGRRSNHWMGTNKMGPKDGTSVVDADTKVYGTDNIFVVDASIFPGQPTGNPSAMIVVASEHAAERIMKLPFTKEQKAKRECLPGKRKRHTG